MGVPSFFNWLIKNKIINDLILNNIPINIDYLFIDTNCLMHPCVNYIIDKYKNNELNIDKTKPIRTQIENFIIEEIEHYILKLLETVKPKITYMAIDGVAPMGKILQQRQRRYKYLYDQKDITEVEDNQLKYPISSIELTPGTNYMERLHKQFTKFAKKNKIIYSSYLEEGEGEHKILQFIRKKTKSTDTFVIYGLDADLLFLSLSISSNNKIYVMRESSVFSNIIENDKKNRNDKSDTTISDYNYVDIDQLKIMIESMGISINDFIIICFLIGNDFIPKILTLDVKRCGLDKIILAYNNIKPMINNDIIKNNKIDHNALILLFEQLKFTEKYVWKNINRKEIDDINRIKFSSDLEYYNHYLGTNWIKINECEIKKMVKNYIETFKWCIDYYLDECKSWKYGYNYHIAPLITDIIKYYPKDINYEHSNCKLKPIEQLILAIPRRTYKFVLQKELIDKLSSMKEFGYLFPDSYDLDVNKDIIDWKYFVKIPIPNFDEYYSIVKTLKI